MGAADILAKVERAGRMSVRDYLALALDSYYAAGPDIGARGDFYTAANVSLFPRSLRRFVEAARERVGKDARVVEIGGGTGALAADLRIDDITIVEPSAALAERQRSRGLRVVGSLAELEPAPTVFIGNEVLDALPVHRVRRTPDGLREAYVEVRGGALVETLGPLSTPALDEAARPLAALLPEGAAAEVNLEARKLLAQMAKAAPRCVVLLIDYGGEREELYGEDRPDGTLRGYHQHRVTGHLERPGEQDVTADVDFTHVRETARILGFEPAGYRVQGEFLADLGLVDDMMRAMQDGEMGTYLAAKNLLLPGGMGERFKALCLARGVAAAPPLPGFRRGFADHAA